MNKTLGLWLIFLCTFSLFFLYRPSFNSYFFQDDWFSFLISRVHAVSDFLKFFVPRTDVIYYRPLGIQVPFFILRSLFGLNVLPFRMITLVTHLISTYTVYRILVKLFNDKKLVFVFSFCFAVSSVFFIPFYWSSTFAFILGPLFFSLSFLLFINKKRYFSFLIFILGFLTNEMVGVFPVIIVLYELIISKQRKVKHCIPFFIFGGILFFIRFLLFKPPTTGSYTLEFSKSFIHNLIGYAMWTLNWPDEMKTQMIKLGVFNPTFIHEYSLYFYTFIITAFIFIILFVVASIYLVKIKGKFPKKLLIFGFLWYLVGISPVIFFGEHSFSYYLGISLIGFFICVIAVLSYLPPRVKYVLAGIFAVMWSMSASTSNNFSTKNHWAPLRAKVSLYQVKKALAQKKVRSDRTRFRIYPIPDFLLSENVIALNNQDALKVFFDNPHIVTVYKFPVP